MEQASDTVAIASVLGVIIVIFICILLALIIFGINYR